MVFLEKFREVIIDDFSIVKETGVGEGPFGCFCYLIVNSGVLGIYEDENHGIEFLIHVTWLYLRFRIHVIRLLLKLSNNT